MFLSAAKITTALKEYSVYLHEHSLPHKVAFAGTYKFLAHCISFKKPYSSLSNTVELWGSKTEICLPITGHMWKFGYTVVHRASCGLSSQLSSLCFLTTIFISVSNVHGINFSIQIIPSTSPLRLMTGLIPSPLLPPRCLGDY